MNEQYSDAFKSIVPDAPASDGWAAGALRKRRNRGRAVAGVAAAAAIALVVPIALTMGGNTTLIATPGQSETPSPQVAGPSPDGAVDAPGAAACWEAPRQPRQATAEGVTDGAARAWLCGDAGNPESLPGAVGPMEPLVDGVEEIVDFIEAQQTLNESGVTMCTEEYTLAYRIVLDYDDGTSRVVPGALHGCQTIDDGPTVRTGGQELYDLVLDLWRRQRERVAPPGDVAVVSQCRPPARSVVPGLPPAMRPMLPLAPADAVTGFTCIEDPADEYGESWGSVLEPDVVALIAQSVARDSEAGEGKDYLPTWVTITGPWGETLSLQRTAVDTFQWFDGQSPMLWKPSSDVLSQLAAALEFPEATPVSSPQPGDQDPLQENRCQRDDDDRMTPTEIPNNVLPDSPAAVWLCDGNGSPLEPLVGEKEMQRVVDTFSDLPASPSAAQYPSPIHAYVLVDYSDGQRYVVEVVTNATFEVRWGANRQHVRYGGAEWVASLRELWVEQRNGIPQTPPVAPGVEICENNLRSLGRGIDRYNEDGALCAVVETDSGVEGMRVPASPQLVEDVRREAEDSGVPWLPGDDNPLLDWEGETVVLVDDYGDRLSLFKRPTGDWFWEEGDKAWTWTPAPELAARLAEAFNESRPSSEPTHS